MISINATRFFLASMLASSVAFADESMLQKQLDTQATQIQQLQSQMEASRRNSREPSSYASESTSPTTIGGYGEAIYNGYRTKNSRNQLDLKRFVIFFGHRFNERLSFHSEVEWESALASSTGKGETSVEQAYVNYEWCQGINIKTGLFLMPFGFINLHHESPVFYGAERNEVETRIIPSTWREGGVGFWGQTEIGLDWDAGVTTGFNVASFNDASKPLGGIRQKMSKAKAHDLSYYGAVNYRIPSFVVGGGLFSGDSNQGNAAFISDATQPDFAGIDARVSLWDIHTRWQSAGWDLQLLYAQGSIGDAEKIDDVLRTYNAAKATTKPYVPSEFYGWLGQAAYSFQVGNTSTLAPFARFETYNTQAKMPAGFSADQANADRLVTAGVSFKPHRQVAFKADYRKYFKNSDNDRVNLGLGYMF